MRKHLHLVLAVAASMILWGGGQKALAEDVDFSTKKVTEISSTAATTIDTEKWYLLEQDRIAGGNNHGDWTPAYDNGEGEVITRASSTNAITAWGEGVIGSYGEDAAKYLVRFVATETQSTAKETSTVYLLQFATGNYFKSNATSNNSGTGVTSTADAEEATSWNVYTIGESAGDFGINEYDMSYSLNNNGNGNPVVSWSSGEVTSTGGNDDWELYEVTLADMTDDDNEAIAQVERNETMLSLIRTADAAYEANNEWTYETSDKLITEASQLSSPYSETSGTDATWGVAGLIDGDATTYWHSLWSNGGADDDVHYFEVELPSEFEGGDLIAYIQRRNSTSDQITKMGVKDGDTDSEDEVIAILDYPYSAAGEELTDHFYCPSGVAKLRFYEEDKANSSTPGCFHLAEFQLYKATLSDDCANSLKSDVAETFAAAIKAASEAYIAKTVTEDDIQTLQAAIDAYNAAISGEESEGEESTATEPYALEVDETDLSHWTLTGNTGSESFQLDTWANVDAVMPTPYIEYWRNAGVGNLTAATITHNQLTDLEEGYYYVSITARTESEAANTLTNGPTLTVNTTDIDLLTAGLDDETLTDGGVAKYNTYATTVKVEDGTLDIKFTVPDGANYNWFAFQGLTVVYLGDDLTNLGYVTGQMNATEEVAMKSAVDAYNADNSDENLAAAVDAIVTACASVDYYETVKAAIDEHLDLLDADGQAYLNENLEAAYEAGTIEDGADYTAEISKAYLAQTTAGSDMTYALVNSGEWTAAQTNLGTFGDGYESYNDTNNFSDSEVLYCTLTGLQPGYYEVSFYAMENAANGIANINSGDDKAVAYANDETAAMTVGTLSAATIEYTSYTFTIKIEADQDSETGTLVYGIKNTAEAGNWAVAQPISLTLLAPTDMNCVYLYNVAEKKFLSRGSHWGTEADIDPYGIPLEIVFSDDNAATVQFLDDDLYLYGSTWAWTDGDPTYTENGEYTRMPATFSITEVEGATSDYGTVYQFVSEYGNLYAWEGTTDTNSDAWNFAVALNGVLGDEINDANGSNYTNKEQAYWVIVDKDTRNAIKDAWVQAQKDEVAAELGIDDIDNYTAAGTDCTSSLTNTYSDGTELYQSASSLTQTVEGLTPGVYKVTLQGLHRMGTNAHCWELGNTYEDLDLSICYLEANGYQINLKPWYVAATYDESTDSYVPNNVTEAGELCDAGEYTNTVYTIVTADEGEETGSLTITIGCPGTESYNWMYVKTLTLTLLDNSAYIEAYEEALAAAEAMAEDTQLTEDALSDLNTAIEENTLETPSAATVAELQKAIDGLNAAVEAAEQAIADLKDEYTAALDAAQAEADEDIKLTTENTTDALGALTAVIEENTLELEGTDEVEKATASEIEAAITALTEATETAKQSGEDLIDAYNEALTALQTKIDEFTEDGYDIPEAFTEAIENCTIEDLDAATGDEIQTAIDGLNTGLATAINGVEAGEDGEVIYTLQGVRVSKATKGIYIKGGKKVIVK